MLQTLKLTGSLEKYKQFKKSDDRSVNFFTPISYILQPVRACTSPENGEIRFRVKFIGILPYAKTMAWAKDKKNFIP